MAGGLRENACGAVRVVYLIDSLIAGGAERSLAAVAPHYARLGVDLEVAYFYERDNVWIPALRAAGASVTSLAGSGGRIARARRARRLIRDRAPDIVHTTLFEADVAGRLGSLGSRVPVVCTLANVGYGPEQFADPAIHAWKLRAAQLIDATTARRVQRFHAVSASIADLMSPRLHVSRRRFEVIPRGRDPEELGRREPARRAAARSRLGIGADDHVVLAIGRHEFQKGFDVLVAAFEQVRAQVPDARLLVAGRTGSATAALTAQIERLGLTDSVELLGFRADAPELLCAADIFVSSSRWEGSPGAVIEAMALEAPIVCTDIVANTEVFGGEACARLVAAGSEAGLAAAIVSVLRDGPDPGHVLRARDRFLDRFTIDRVAAAMVAFYDGIEKSAAN